MYSLSLLGGVSLAGPEGPLSGRVVQRRPIALLAMLATSERFTMSRDALIAHLWPEASAGQARPRLSTALYAIRRSLGSRAVESLGDNLRLNPDVVEADIARFEEALTAEDLERAVELYGGPFLDGFHVRGSREFERWVDARRTQYANSYARALESLADATERRGERVKAARLWRRLAEHDPYNARVTLRLMQALDAAGDRAAALKRADTYERLIVEDLGAEPNSEVTALAGRLRTTDGSPSFYAERRESALRDDTAEGLAGSAAGTLQDRRPGRLLVVTGMLLMLGVLSGAAWLLHGQVEGPAATAEAIRVAVLPFQVRGPQESQYLGEGFPLLLSVSIDGAGPVRSVDPEAVFRATRDSSGSAGDGRPAVVVRRLEADVYVTGDIVVGEDRLTVTARPHGRTQLIRSSPVTVEGREQELPALVDDVGLGLMGSLIAERPTRWTGVAIRSTDSLSALKAYLEGVAFDRRPIGGYLHEHRAAAAEAFERAIEIDSTFALAHYELASTIELSDPARAARAIRDAIRHAEGLHWRYRSLLAALDLRLKGRHEKAEQLYTAVVDRYPMTVEAHFDLGEMIFHEGKLYGRSALDARRPLEHALRLDPGRTTLAWRLGVLSAIEGDAAGAAAQLKAALGEEWVPGKVMSALAMGGRLSQRIIGELREAPQRTVLNSTTSATLLGDFQNAALVARLLTEDHRPAVARLQGYWYLAQLETVRGRWTAAKGALREAGVLSPGVALQESARLAVLPFVPATPRYLDSLRTRLEGFDPERSSGLRMQPLPEGASAILTRYHIASLSVALGDTVTARNQAAELENLDLEERISDLARDLAVGIRARLAFRAGRSDEANTLLDEALRTKPVHLLTVTEYAQAHERFLRAEHFRNVGQLGEARAWYRSLSLPGQIVFQPAARFGLAEIAMRRGKPDEAGEHYAEVLRLWRDAEAGFQSTVRTVDRRLEQLESG